MGTASATLRQRLETLTEAQSAFKVGARLRKDPRCRGLAAGHRSEIVLSQKSYVATSPVMGRTNQLIALDLLRGLAAIAVLLAHVRGDSFVEYGLLPLADRGVYTALFYAVTRLAHEAVIVFFVLSGFLVGGQVIRGIINNRFDPSDYAIDRTTRILLPLIPACLLSGAVASFVFGQPTDWLTLSAHMIGLNEVIVPTTRANPVLWSLAYEIWFYVLGGALAVMVLRRSVIAVAVVMICLFVFTILKPEYLMYWVLGRVDKFDPVSC
jgi:peptidoglycan/LPS O-acetylase OafA/YrhL